MYRKCVFTKGVLEPENVLPSPLNFRQFRILAHLSVFTSGAFVNGAVQDIRQNISFNIHLICSCAVSYFQCTVLE